jgi:MoaD family protein
MPLIKLYANLRTVTGKKEMNVPGASIREVLERLILDFPNIQGYLLEKEQLRSRLIIAINGQTLDPETGVDAPVSEQDQIAIFPPVAGG